MPPGQPAKRTTPRRAPGLTCSWNGARTNTHGFDFAFVSGRMALPSCHMVFRTSRGMCFKAFSVEE
eukprot:4567579-Amphidinium_carterae.2